MQSASPLFTSLARIFIEFNRPTTGSENPTGGYYALLKRGGKQFRRALRTKDRKLAERRLAELRKQVGSLIVSPDANLSFEKITERWMAATSHTLKSRSKSRRLSAIKAVAKFFRGLAI